MNLRLGVTAASLGVAASLAIAGCAPKAEQEAQVATEASPLAQGEKAVKRETWVSEPFSLEDSAEVRVGVALTSGPAIDVYVLSEADFNRWNTLVSKAQESEDQTFEHFSSLGLEGLSASFTSEWNELPAGTYYLVIDNTSFGGTSPPSPGNDDIATVSYQIEARPLSE